MGAWGPGLYSDDFALDLKTTISAVCRLPYEGSKVLELLIDLHPVALDEQDEDYATFWLVAGDQLQKKGLATDARVRARETIESRGHLDDLQALGMNDSDLRKRAKMLEQLSARLESPPEPRERRTMKKPQPLLAQPGEVYVFPVDSRGNPYNPYFTKPEDARFQQASWGSCLVVGAGHALDFLAWYQIAVCDFSWPEVPSLEVAARRIDPKKNGIGTLPKTHIKRMGLELAGLIDIPVVPPPSQERVIAVAASDISASNILCRWLPEDSLPPKRR